MVESYLLSVPRIISLVQILNSRLLRPEVELENRFTLEAWGLTDVVSSDFQVEASSQSHSHDPITRRAATRHHSRPVAYRLSDVTFNPSVGSLGHKGHRIRESVTIDFHRTHSWDSSRVPRKIHKTTGTATALRLHPNYYHFIAEDLPRIALLKKHLKLNLVYSQKRPFPRFITDALEFLEIDHIVLSRPTRFDELAFVGPMDDGFWPSPVSLEIVRESLSPMVPSFLGVPTGQIYLSRRKSSRALNSEYRVESFFAKLGFAVIHAQDLSLAQQIELFSTCRTLIGPHGAGLTNALFMPPGGRVIEIIDRKWAIPVYERVVGTRHRFSQVLVDENTAPEKLIEVFRKLLHDDS